MYGIEDVEVAELIQIRIKINTFLAEGHYNSNVAFQKKKTALYRTEVTKSLHLQPGLRIGEVCW